MKQTLLLAILVFLFTSCENSTKKVKATDVESKEITVEKQIIKDCKDVHWSHHKGNDGPRYWKSICEGFSDCGGGSQSPINIVIENVSNGNELLAPKFSYGESTVNIINNSHTIQFNVDGENMVNLNGKDYQLLQFHYHSLSEHTINGQYFPLEVHFVHRHSDTDFAVLGIMFEEGKTNKLFEKYLNVFPTKSGEFNTDERIDLLGLFPENKSYFAYSGSLTTPPCSEIVNWYIIKNPVEASKQQIETFSKILNDNFRPIQPSNDRVVKLYSE